MTDTGMLKAPSDWQTERDPVNVAVIGKMGEEAAELANICFRSIIQCVDGLDPKNGKHNLDALFEEMADVTATIRLAEMRFNRQIDPARVEEKLAHKLAWLTLIKPRETELSDLERADDGTGLR